MAINQERSLADRGRSADVRWAATLQSGLARFCGQRRLELGCDASYWARRAERKYVAGTAGPTLIARQRWTRKRLGPRFQATVNPCRIHPVLTLLVPSHPYRSILFFYLILTYAASPYWIVCWISKLFL